MLQPDKSARDLFGSKVRDARNEEGWSLEQLGRKVGLSKSHMGRIETADYMPPPGLAERLDELFGRGKDFRDLYRLARREIHPDQFRRRMELESKAVAIREYAPQIVPGLLQTADYARAHCLSYYPMAEPERLRELVGARIARQRELRSRGAHLSVILDEAVLHRAYGGPNVMREQFARLLGAPLTPYSVIQVLPFAHGGHAFAGGSVSLLTLDRGSVVAYEEAVTTGVLFEDQDEANERARHYDLLAASALSPKESADMIRSAMEALPHEHHP
ncbi:helix-turn-helix transcriptional regulator [Streptomyces albidoflavus]|uniref:helix-turn-helix domain-containing protein n=1 Tax=Streptomyces albidoflavus TaxID=1886 RepID=UPI0033E4CAAB